MMCRCPPIDNIKAIMMAEYYEHRLSELFCAGLCNTFVPSLTLMLEASAGKLGLIGSGLVFCVSFMLMFVLIFWGG